jgi:hypothetical protein
MSPNGCYLSLQSIHPVLLGYFWGSSSVARLHLHFSASIRFSSLHKKVHNIPLSPVGTRYLFLRNNSQNNSARIAVQNHTLLSLQIRKNRPKSPNKCPVFALFPVPASRFRMAFTELFLPLFLGFNSSTCIQQSSIKNQKSPHSFPKTNALHIPHICRPLREKPPHTPTYGGKIICFDSFFFEKRIEYPLAPRLHPARAQG